MKPIRISRHAEQRILLRGATSKEVIQTINESNWTSAKANRYQASQRFEFRNISPVNNQYYLFKTINVIFVEEVNEIVVVTVKVFYHNS